MFTTEGKERRWIMSGTILKGIIHGKSIELTERTSLPDGQEVSVEIQPIIPKKTAGAPPQWLKRFEVNSAARPGKFVVAGTQLLADELVARLKDGWSDNKLLIAHPELTAEDVAALREYAKLPPEMRRCFGAWAEDAEELDKYLDWNRQQRKAGRREI
jgi:uncharacterized protein (DUF433 family)